MKIKRIIVLLLGFVVVACGAALTLKAAVGVGAWDAMSQTGCEITGIEVGTIGMFTNFMCIGIQMLILKKDFRKIQYLQIILSVLLGVVINFVLYTLLAHVTLTAYWMNFCMLILGYIISAFAVGAVMVLDIVTFPVEGACMAYANKYNKKFHVIRQGLDVVAIIIAVALALIFKVDFAVREGTVVGMLLFGPLMGIFMKIQKPLFKKLDLIDYD